jgi:hypothetical protein
MPFTPVEEQHYRQLFEEMCADIGLDTEGAPLSETWEPDSVAESMRRWLVRLRQTALHPEVGGRNKKALGQKDRPLRTIDQVLDAVRLFTPLPPPLHSASIFWRSQPLEASLLRNLKRYANITADDGASRRCY